MKTITPPARFASFAKIRALVCVGLLGIVGCGEKKPAAKVPPPALELIGAAERAFDEWQSAKMAAMAAGLSTDLENMTGNTSEKIRATMDEMSKHGEVQSAYEAYLRAERAARKAEGSAYEIAQVAAFQARVRCRAEMMQIKRDLDEALVANNSSETIRLEAQRQACEARLEKLKDDWIKVWYSGEWKLHVE